MPPDPLPISVTILCKNSSRYLVEVLQALQRFDQVLIYDNGSTDDTIAIAQRFSNVTVKIGDFLGFGPTHNIASALAKHDWILSIDSDEVISSELVEEIACLLQADGGVNFVCSIPRNNYYNGRWIRWCGWYPDRQWRLYNRTATRFSEQYVHEGVVVAGLEKLQLHSPMKHYSYADTKDFLAKMQHYSELFAKQNCGKKSSSVWSAIAHGAFAFFKSYILKRGVLGGYEGFVISVYNGNTAFYKYLKLREYNRS